MKYTKYNHCSSPFSGMLEHFAKAYVEFGGKEDVSGTTDSIISTISRESTKLRHEHLGCQRSPALECAGQVYRPANFIQFCSDDRNHGDRFWITFHKTYLQLPEPMMASITTLTVSQIYLTTSITTTVEFKIH